ncbi:MAG: nucleotide sugar dehydrogenase [Rudaea sp.]
MSTRIAIVGLGYVGLPVAVCFAEAFPGTIGFDISERRIASLKQGIDSTSEIESERLKRAALRLTRDPADLRGASVFIVCVPTPIYKDRRPDLTPLRSASETVGRAMSKGAIVIFESTVYPGVTEEYCGAILAKVSGLTPGVDFKLAYSPERINPGDKEHRFETIKKVVSGEDAETAETVAKLYGAVVPAGIHIASSIKVAEAAKVLENTQRDLNIALMNELALICDLLHIRTKDVLDAAATKWNFLRFAPGLVGGHCIGVDPYYLTSKAEELGYHPQVILAGRRINDSMAGQIARRTIRFLGKCPRPLCETRVGVLGLTFKENVPDIRNSRIPDIVAELREYGIKALVHDPLADPGEISHEYGLEVSDLSCFSDLDALVLAVPHRQYLDDPDKLYDLLAKDGTLIDVKSALDPANIRAGHRYWSL